MAQTNSPNNSNPGLNIPFYAQNPFNNVAGGMQIPTSGYNPLAQVAPISTNPMFGRPEWTYVNVVTSPMRGPQPRLARGTGRTGNPSLPGNSALLPGYLSDNEYLPSLDDYNPVHDTTFEKRLPRTIHTGNDGVEIVGTYRAHDFTPGTRMLAHTRQAANWQQMSYPPNYRNLLAWQQVQRYRIQNATLSARPLTASNYFLGYQVTSEVQGQIGQSGLGYMGGT